MFSIKGNTKVVNNFLKDFRNKAGGKRLRLTPLSDENETFSLTLEENGVNKSVLFRMANESQIPVFEKTAAKYDDLKPLKVKFDSSYVLDNVAVITVSFNNIKLDIVVSDFNVIID